MTTLLGSGTSGMKARHFERLAVTLLVACVLWPSNTLAQQGESSLDKLVARIPHVAGDGGGVGWFEQALAEQLQAYGAEAIPRLLPLLEDKRKGIREFVGFVLRDISGLTEEHLDALINARKKGNGWIPPAIGRIGTPRAIDFLVHDLERNPEMGQVSYALEIAGEPAAFALAQRFRAKRSNGFDNCACDVFRSMREHASAAVGPLLDVALDRTLSFDLRRRALEALPSCGPGARRAANSLLALAASDREEFQESVESALVQMHAPECMPILLRRLESGTDNWAVGDLEQMGADGVAAGPLVLKLLDHEDHELHAAAARTLGSIGYTPAIGALSLRASDGDDWALAADAIESLVQLRATSSIETLDAVAKSHWSPFIRAKALRASRRLHALARGVVAPFGFAPEEDDGMPPFDPSNEPMPSLTGGPDTLSSDVLGPLTYLVDTQTYGSSGWHTESKAEHPGCGLRVDGGLLLGASRGEFGGEVVYVQSGLPQERILATNTVGLHRLGDTIVAVTGLAHMMSNYGELYRIDRRPDGSFSATWWKRLPGAPRQSGIRADGSLFVRCRGGDVVIKPSGAFELAY